MNCRPINERLYKKWKNRGPPDLECDVRDYNKSWDKEQETMKMLLEE